MRVVKQFRFEAAHKLPHHDGKCRDLHGHSYLVEVACWGDVKPANGDPDEGMVIDFHRISDVFKEYVHTVVDHKFLNDVLPVGVTTAENIAAWILDVMRSRLPMEVEWVRVWETTTGYAEAS